MEPFVCESAFDETTEKSGTFDITTDATDPHGWIQEGEASELILPVGVYEIRCLSTGEFSGTLSTVWSIILQLDDLSIVLPSAYPFDTCYIDDVTIINITTPVTVTLMWSRNDDSPANGGCTLTITKLA